MSSKAHIDGNRSVMPGAANKVANQVFGGDDDQKVEASPIISNSKRPIACIASSPTKKPKDSVERDLKCIVDNSSSTSDSEASTANTNLATSSKFATLTSEIEAIMDKVVECGAPEGSAEYYIATTLFSKSINRCFFNIMKTSEAVRADSIG